MNYTIFKAGNKEYKCKLSTKNLISLEKRMGANPLNIFMSINETSLPKLEDMLLVLHESLQSLEHGISMDDIYDIYDSYIEDGNTFVDLIAIVMDIYKVSGLVKEEEKKSTKKGKASNEKN